MHKLTEYAECVCVRVIINSGQNENVAGHCFVNKCRTTHHSKPKRFIVRKLNRSLQQKAAKRLAKKRGPNASLLYTVSLYIKYKRQHNLEFVFMYIDKSIFRFKK